MSASPVKADDAENQRIHYALVERMRTGDEQALGTLYDATVTRLYSLALRIARSPQTADEVVEETYFQAWRQAADYTPTRGPVVAWLLTICRSRALDALRRNDPAESMADPAALLADTAEDGCDPCDLLLATRRTSAVHGALAQLTPAARQLIGLAFFRGLTHSEIAQVTGQPLGTVKTTLHRACRKLQGLLAGQHEEP
jgi:RNA polymerase sigma-70 factor (ECF subfamily)